jgi:hypothetical protein
VVAAVLYGVGARLDARPELLFELRGVDQAELVARAGKDLPLARKGPAAGRVLGEEGLSELFGIDLAEGSAPAPARPRRGRPAAKRVAGKRVAGKRVAGKRVAGKPKPRPGARSGSRG